MRYENKGGQSREKTMLAAWAMVRQFGSTQADVARALRCSQSTVAQWVKEIDYQRQIRNLEADLADARQYIEQLQHELPYNP
ncbi:helix-turn-helix domain-containing protein [Vibrio fluvialis]|nr:helix-turn-helix domain-containing protein [Vibrio fluvialis]MBY7870170.1 helix-turn-helix domain-containing protein [Vibrio fluvialis]MBY8164907.1 helix-turn-helix domain-containing protein [Vibrio fluvialis]